ncbi:UDP-N-acetylmuramoylalanine--D-glutamate ligase [Candidatus Providencia siddallii]|uniref:UDP-N-acetylmuramoylalanine--D-glutamate ligase n=1 Tax=Candidatus Providencia siddallii TaxID=1715285 RepID=A0A0M6W7R3_9GAMM|nr:UDP-N-acetylmuramoylalanine--D-glutamate ligase [Candidatus Providencia siddallii]
MLKQHNIDYQNKKIIILGIGITGLSCIKFFLANGVKPIVMDTRKIPPFISKIPKNIKLFIGKLNNSCLQSADLIIISPGITKKIPELVQAEKNGIKIISDIELFCHQADAPIIAITGTNGKSTVTSLIGEIAKTAGISVGIGGNIGIPALSLLNSGYSLYVLELSSFQLETTYSLKAISATVLNISDNHLDRYKLGLQEYRENKLKIYNNSQNRIVNIQDILTLPKNCSVDKCITFGLNNGNYLFDTKKNKLIANNQVILNAEEMHIKGQHNYLNALAALALADTINIPRNISIKALKKYSGLPHRFQLIFFNKGVSWINDSKSTNVASTKAALSSLYINGRVHLLLGGDGKSADFSPLKMHININIYKIYCFGRDAKFLAKLFPKKSIITETMEQSLHLISQNLKKGDVVLLSPACSSLDQFKNFEHRGNVFTQLAKKLG